MDWKEISVFISSTFNDMHAERDYVLKNVFPQLGEWCERHHIFLRDIDLRWGVTLQDTKTQNTIYQCLTAVDRCRPFFLCFLGQRRGWVPEIGEISLLTREVFPEIERMIREERRSATEYEIEHALLMPLAFFAGGNWHREEPVRNALFLRRKPDYLADLTPAQKQVFLDYEEDRCETPEGYAEYLRVCREANEEIYRRVAEKNLVVEYSCRWDPDTVSPELLTDGAAGDRARGRLTDFTVHAENLPAGLREELLETLRREFPGELPEGETWPLKTYLLAAYARQLLPYCDKDIRMGSRYERDAEQQTVFKNICLRDAVPREDCITALDTYCEGSSRCPLLVTADSGMGKTTLSALFASWRKDALVRFLGVSEMSGGWFPLWESILEEAGLSPPADPDALQAKMPEYLAAMSPRVLLLDGLEQIPGGLELSEQLPVPLPAGIKVILTFCSDSREERTERFLRFHADYPQLRLQSFSDAQKKNLIRTHLSSSLKNLSPEQTELVCGLNESGNPLFLTVLLSDIRTFGSYAQLQAEIRRHGRTPVSAFDAMLSRMENDRMFDMLPPGKCIPLVFGLLAAARDGLSYEELTDCLALCFPDAGRERCAGSLHICLRQVRAFLRRFEERTDFLHRAFREAALQRHASRGQEFHRVLADLFRNECDPDGDAGFRVRDRRALREYAWHLSFVSGAEFCRLYGNICWLNARCGESGVRDLIREYDHPLLKEEKHVRDLLIRYRDGLEQYPNLLPSLLWTYGTDKEREEAGFERLRCAWIRMEGCPSAEEKTVSAAEAGGIRVLGDIRWHAAAFCFADTAPVAFAFSGQGQITAYDLQSMLPFSNPILTSTAMPLGLCASGGILAAAFEDERIELYAYETDGNILRSKPAGSLSYLPPLYSGAAMCFDRRRRLWYQPEEETIAFHDPDSGERRLYEITGAEEISSLAASGNAVFGTACAGRNTLLFCLDGNGNIHLKDLGAGDSRVLYADRNGCMVTLAASEGMYPLVQVNETLCRVRETDTEYPVTAAAPMGASWLLLPARQAVNHLWLWDGEKRKTIEQQLLFLDQAKLYRLEDGSFAMLSEGALTRFVLSAAGKEQVPRDVSGPEILPEEIPDLNRYDLRRLKFCANGGYACATGFAKGAAAVRDEQCASAVFLKKSGGNWRALGGKTWPRAYDLIRTVCIDPESGCFTLLFRSVSSAGYVCAESGKAEELCAGKGLMKELPLPQNKTNFGCFAGGTVWLSAGEILHAYDPKNLSYQTAIQLPAPVTEIRPDGERAAVRAGDQEYTAVLQKGEAR